MRKTILLAAVAAAGSMPALAQPASAQAGLANQNALAAAQNRSGDIIVTASKRSERINDLAEAVTAFTSNERQIIGISTLADMAKFTPGLSYDSSADRVFLRGVGRTTNTAGSDPGVATYTDGIYDSSTSSIANDDFFVARVEVLRGPQGTLYGRNSIGGAINAISVRPSDKLTVEGRALVANFDTERFHAAISGPLSEHVRARIAGTYQRQGKGYFRNLAGGPSEGGAGDFYYVEAQVEADLAPNATLWVKAFNSGTDQRARTSNFITPYDYGPFPSGSLTPGAPFGYLLPSFHALGDQTSNPGMENPFEFSTNTTTRLKMHDSFGVQGQFDVSLEPFDVRFLSGYREYVIETTNDLDNTSMLSYDFPLSDFSTCGFVPGCTPLTVYPSTMFGYYEGRKFGSAELDFLSNKSGNLNWIAGLYYYGESLRQRSHFNSVDQLQLRSPANGPANPDGDFVYAGTDLRTSSYAAFGQIDWDVAPKLRLTAGLRYSYDRKRAEEALRVVCFGCVPGLTPDQLGSLTPAIDLTDATASFADARGVVVPTSMDPLTGRAQRTLRNSWNAVSGTLGAEWRPTDESLIYLSYSRGYKSGGFNAGGITAEPQTNPEYVNAYQGGVKQQLGTLQLNVAGYYYDYRGLQIPLNVPQISGVNITSFFNLRRARSYGVEVEALWNVTPEFQILGNYAYANSRIKACCYFDGADPGAVAPGAQPSGPAVGTNRFQSLDGAQLPLLPNHKLAVNASYTLKLDPGSFILSGSYSWVGRSWSNVFNRPYYRVPSSDTVDLRLLWTDSKDRYRIILFAKNLLNSTNFTTAVNQAGAASAEPYSLTLDPRYPVNYGLGVAPPRTFGAEFHFRF